MTTLILTVFIAITAIAAIYVYHIKKNVLFSWLKPLTSILVLALAVSVYAEHPTAYSQRIIASLIFAIIGDIYLIQYRYLLKGIIAFSLAHFGFSYAFTGIYGFYADWRPLVILFVIFLSYYFFLRKHLRGFKWAIGIYMIIIMFMNWQAIGLFLTDQRIRNIGLLIASVLFSFSDSVIAFNIFKNPFRISEHIILATYWLAIYIFSLAGKYI